jgi:predicted aspartyl protease
MRAAPAAAVLILSGCVSVTRDRDLTARLESRSEPFYLGTPIVRVEGASRVPMKRLFGLPAVTARSGDHTFTLLIDSGSQFCMLRPELVEELALPVSGHMRLSLLGETSDALITCIPRLSVGSVHCQNLPLVVSPGHLERHVLGLTIETLDGVLGMPFLHQCVTTVDVHEGLVMFKPFGAYTVPRGKGVHVLPLHFLRDGRPSAVVSIGRSRHYFFLLDTGARRCVLRHDVARQIGLPDLGTVRLMSLGVEVRAYRTELPSISFGDVTAHDAPAYVLPEAHGHMLKNVDGLLGMDLLERFAVTIDPSREVLVLVDRG